MIPSPFLLSSRELEKNRVWEDAIRGTKLPSTLGIWETVLQDVEVETPLQLSGRAFQNSLQGANTCGIFIFRFVFKAFESHLVECIWCYSLCLQGWSAAADFAWKLCHVWESFTWAAGDIFSSLSHPCAGSAYLGWRNHCSFLHTFVKRETIC